MKKKLLIALVVMAAAGGGGWYGLQYFSSDDATASELAVTAGEVDSHGAPVEEKSGFYLPLDPPFVVNFSHLGMLRYLQASMVVRYSDQDHLDLVSQHMPAIRNDLIMLLSDQPFERLNSAAGKEELREELMTAINTIVHAEMDAGELFFTNFVMQ